MKIRIALSLLLAGTAILTLGGLFKLLHWPTANIQLMIGALVQVVALFVLAVKIATTDGLPGMLNR
ncbi:MAG: hypothetical protein KBA60_06490 [Flavobacteriales bacterium]|nr:hypothetical protein [Flavobacteriales bacterium]MBP6643800.1 hypothetical protein [Flavobacteriales bacterium]MBP7155637.1 hypothetical protein [Flavobacteriales bacterium]HQV75599.1 hypothetical protein [Flavobacteriales bacterium]HQW41987.1 hypothetical protein [Flavobacteriales bacterium]